MSLRRCYELVRLCCPDTGFRLACVAMIALGLGLAAPLPAQESSAAPGSLHSGAPGGPAAGAAADAANPGDLPRSSVAPEYKIGADDVLSITVWHEPELSRSAPVRPDGMISLPLVGQVAAAGKTTAELEATLRAQLAQFIKSPEIYIMVAQIRSRHINIIGEVQHPGTFTLMQSMGVLDAIAGAGGLRDFAKKNKIYILREDPNGTRLRINYDYQAVLRGKSGAKEIALQPNDTVVVP